VLAGAAAHVAVPWPLKVLFDHVLREAPIDSGPATILESVAGDDRQRLLAVTLLAFLALVALAAVIDYGSARLLNGTGERLAADLRAAIFAHLQRQSLAYHERQRVGDLTTRITADVGYVQELLIASLSLLLPNVTILLGIVGVLLAVEPQFGALAVAMVPLLFLTVFSYTRRIKRASRRARRMESDIAAVASETLSLIRVVHAHAAEPRHERIFGDRNLERLAAGLEATSLQAKLRPMIDFATAAATALVLWFGARRVLSGEISLGLLVVFLVYLTQLYRPVRHLSSLAMVVSRGQASAERLHEVLSTDVRVVERADAVEARSLDGAVALRAVSFGYSEQRAVLHDVSIEIAAGERVALVGPTGAGKSTLVSLIPRFYDPWQGEVLVDGRDVRSFTLRSLRSQIALVLQDSLLFHATIFDNIAYGRQDATADEVFAAAEAAYVDEFVRDLPERYDTVVSERATTLSAGQRQRIAIARALVRDAPIVILDEPTSGLDAVSERYVMSSIERLMAGRTVLLVAHRLSIVRDVDRIYVLDRGRTVDAGAHEELARRGGLYRRLQTAARDRGE
jgi:ATP-binding cassette subfamily B protein